MSLSARKLDPEYLLRALCRYQSSAHRAPGVLSHDIVLVLNTGSVVDGDRWKERKLREEELREQTNRLADVLERNGIPARTKASTVYSVALVTGDVDELPCYRSICFLPAVAKRERAPLLNELRLFRKTHRNHRKYMRFAVVTCGPRVPAGAEGALRGAFHQLHRSLSRWNQWASRKYGIDVVGRFSEFTVRDEGGVRTLHPHANVLLTPRKPLSKKEWRSFLRETHELFGFWWSDRGKLEQPEEAIKYVCKPADLDLLSDSEIVWLFNELYRLKLAHPMGPFQAWRRDTLCERRDRGWYKDRKVVSVEAGSSAQLRVVAKKWRTKASLASQRNLEASDTDCSEIRTRFLGITLPQRRATPWAEPSALIQTDLDPVKLGHRAFVDEWAQQVEWSVASDENFQEFLRAHKVAKKTWQTNGAPPAETALAIAHALLNDSPNDAANVRPFIVHTYRSTARGEDITARLHDLEACLRDTERITTTYTDLVPEGYEKTDFDLWDFDQILGQDDDAEEEFVDYDLVTEGSEEEEKVFGECGTIIRSMPSGITPLGSASDWSP